ncbi:MAG: anaerobic ribonucleoside-triphosphate reductase activating protein [Sphaerochaetaceae bacterium]|nr:anaerobic ribonucleoside-triphosphate reductase activating protein [Spirochaetales bacterium]MDY5968028.1 anaerobic ribonucleoside-triphosphate reductase activating protein [Sphaerochaetaceae bacterium]
MTFEGIQKFTLLDYPNHIACTLFSPSCNFRCPYCHNAGIITSSPESGRISEGDVISFLKTRKKLIEGVCISGGEPTLQKGLVDFIARIRDMGFKVKLDTNGYNTSLLEDVIEKNLVNYIAMDVKSSFASYALCSGVANIDVERIRSSIELIKNSKVDYEFRTTLVRELHSDDDILSLADYMRHVLLWRMQEFRTPPSCSLPLSPIPSKYLKSLLNQYINYKNYVFY